MNKFFTYFTIVITIFILSGCHHEKATILKKDFLDTKVGMIKDQKLIVEIKKVKVKKIIVKKEIKVIKPKIIKKPKKKVITVNQKKKYFKDTIVPIATEVYNNLQKQYLKIKKHIQNGTNEGYIEALKIQYKAKTDEKLLQALKPHPISILLAQAAIESAWLTSRFSKDANNIFGVWSFNKKEPRIAATGLRGSKTIYLKKYKSLNRAVEDYYKSIAKSWAYKEFRRLRTTTNDPYELLPHLESYSEKKQKYTQMLKKVIAYNQFDRYDINSSF